MSKNIAAYALFRSQAHVEEAIAELRNSGFRNTDVSVLLPENSGNKDLAHEMHTKAPEGAVTGAGSGAILGGALGWLVGIGALAIPGIGPILAAGPIVAALAGIGAVGTLGGVTGALIGAGMPEYEAKRYEGRLKSGGILLSVHCDSEDWAKRANAALKRAGGEDIATASEAPADYAVSDRPAERSRTSIV